MTVSQHDLEPTKQVEAVRKAFEQEFERFARFTSDTTASDVELEQALAYQHALAELRTRHLGKKSELAAAKKLIGRVAVEERASFGQLVQATEAEVLAALEKAEQNLKGFIEAERTAQNRLI